MLKVRIYFGLAGVLAAGSLVLGASPAAAAAAPCSLWTRPAGNLGWGNATQMPQLDLRGGLVTVGDGGMRYILTVTGLPAQGASLIPNGASAVAWEMRWSYTGVAYYAAARVTAAAPGTVTYDVGSLVRGAEVPSSSATGSIGSGPGGAVAIDVPTAAVGSPAPGATLAAPIGQVYVIDLTGARTLAAQGGPGGSYQLGQSCGMANAATAGPAAPSAAGAPSSAPQTAGSPTPDSAGLATIGELQLPSSARTLSASLALIPFPIVGNRAYYTYNLSGSSWMLAYDLSSPVPTLLSNTNLNTDVTYGFGNGRDYRTIDPDDNQALMVGWATPVSSAGPSPTLAGTPAGSLVLPIDLKTMKPGQPWDLTASAPGFIASGITYSSKDHRAYLVGDMSGDLALQPFTYRAENAAVVSLDPTTGVVDWVRVITGCQKVLNTQEGGSVVVSSQHEPALYFACWPGTPSSAAPVPGQADVIRLWLKPGATQVDALTFPVDVFPISGLFVSGYVTGTADFDYGSDRFFFLSQSATTPGAWVLDGPSSSWAGFVSSPNSCDDYVAVDSSTGRLLLAADDPRHSLGSGSTACSDRPGGWVLTSDGRQLPPPQGVLVNRHASGQMTVDTAGHRFFMPQERAAANATVADWHIVVVKDEAPPLAPAQILNYDSLTNDVPEGAGTRSDFAGGSKGFGTRLQAVGGLGALQANTDCGSLYGCGTTGIEPGDRGLYAARAGQMDLRPVGASAAGQAMQPDSLTSNDITTQSGNAARWPWSPSSCLDAGGGKISDPQSGPGSASAIATCDLKGRKVTLSAAASALDAGNGLTVADSEISSTAWLDRTHGTQTDTTSIAKDLDLMTPVGELRIGRALSEAKTSAHGRHGTAQASLRQLIEHFSVLDASGNVILSCDSVGAGGCDPTTAASAANSVLNGYAHLTFPQGQVTATSGGAFAEVRKSNTDFYNDQSVNDDNSYEVPALQLVVYNDGADRSRLLVQLAGVQASSIYEITQVHPISPFDDGQLLTTDLTTFADLPPVPDAPRPAASRSFLVTTVRRFAEGLGILFRSPLQAIGIFAFLSLFGLAAGATWRRRALSRALVTGGSS